MRYVEQDLVVSISKPGKGRGGGGCQAETVPWGITRAFVIDTGINQVGDLNIDTGLAANFVTRGKNRWTDGNGHGTHVAGTIAAIDNDCDVVGVRPALRWCLSARSTKMGLVTPAGSLPALIMWLRWAIQVTWPM